MAILVEVRNSINNSSRVLAELIAPTDLTLDFKKKAVQDVIDSLSDAWIKLDAFIEGFEAGRG